MTHRTDVLVDGVEVRFGDGPSRVLAGAAAAVCDRDELRTWLRRLATELGAELLRGRVTACEPHPGGHHVTPRAGR
ncbi:hypothetical protein [Nonomuraea sp. NPDC049158]|uniref:hypothetical protein n=1 Tax=Nonomuraea sp. NPDC049158 TaxID=3155649 RepID=UPI0033E19CBA